MKKDGHKDDAGKARWDLLPYGPLSEVVRVLTFGAKKYGDGNWRDVEDADARYFAAAVRHLVAWKLGEGLDPETGASHLAHAVCCLLFILGAEGLEDLAEDADPECVCMECGKNFGSRIPENGTTWHQGTCEICGARGVPVTQPRDFGHISGHVR